MSLIDSITQAQIKILDSISKAYKTSEILKMYGSRQGEYYRMQIELLKSKFFTGKMDKEKYIQETFENLIALSKVDTVRFWVTWEPVRKINIADGRGTENAERFREKRVRSLHQS